MKTFIAIGCFIIIIFCTSCCVEQPKTVIDTWEESRPKPYDPEKAGAAIVSSYDVTDVIDYSFRVGYDMAEYNSRIYIRIKDVISVFDKETMVKEQDITLNLPLDMLSSYKDERIPGGGLVITDNNVFLLINTREFDKPYNAHFFSVDLATGNVVRLENEKLFGMPLVSYSSLLMGYDKVNNILWMCVWEINKTFFYFYRYNEETQVFEIVDKQAGFLIGPNQKEYARGMVISGTESWCSYFSSMGGIEKRNTNNPEVILKHINIQYLDCYSLPDSFIYDEPYLWIFAMDKDRKTQLLKLLPNE